MADHNVLFYSFLIPFLFFAELIYFRIARRHNIIDKPNVRSSHVNPVIRGGGVIFFIALSCWFLAAKLTWPWFMLGSLLVFSISFLDDLYPQKALLRFLVHCSAMMLLFYQVGLFIWPLWLLLLALVVCIGTINAFNFMDGINGITGVYALVTIFSFLYIQQNVWPFTSATLLITLAISIFVFLFFNFRKQAKCFAGDVGSVTLAFSVIFLLLQLIVSTDSFVWVLFLLVYGTDAVITIVYRLTKRENIFKAHRTHLYQYMSNELRFSHLHVSILYGIVQLIINVAVILLIKEFNMVTVIFILVFMFCYTVIRELVLRRTGQRGLFPGRLAG